MTPNTYQLGRGPKQRTIPFRMVDDLFSFSLVKQIEKENKRKKREKYNH